MKFNVCSVKLNYFTCANYQDGCNTVYRNLPTSFALGLRNTSGTQVGRAEWNKNELGVTKKINFPKAGNYALNSRFYFDNGSMYGVAKPGDSCYETYPRVSFSVALTFTPNT